MPDIWHVNELTYGDRRIAAYELYSIICIRKHCNNYQMEWATNAKIYTERRNECHRH